MKLNRMFVGLSSVGLLSLTAGAAGPREVPSSPPAAPASVDAPASGVPQPAADGTQQFIQRLAGEWDGAVEMRKESGEVSSSVINVSSQLQRDGKGIISCFDGYIFGQPFEGGSLVGFNPRSGQFESAWFDHVSGSTIKCSAAACDPDSPGTLRFTGRLTSKTGRAVNVEQVLTMTDFKRYTNEWFIVADNGDKSRFMLLEMTRMPEGQVSSAFARLKSASEQARSRDAMVNVPDARMQN